jgi:hypothetical protein
MEFMLIVEAGNYCVRYFFGALGTAVVLPAIQKIGVGWFSTISAATLVIMTVMIYINVLYGKGWRDSIDAKKAAKKAAKGEQ